jgi:hypothetical protein
MEEIIGIQLIINLYLFIRLIYRAQNRSISIFEIENQKNYCEIENSEFHKDSFKFNKI